MDGLLLILIRTVGWLGLALGVLASGPVAGAAVQPAGVGRDRTRREAGTGRARRSRQPALHGARRPGRA